MTATAHRTDQEGGRPSLPLFLTEGGRALSEYGLFLAARPLLRALPLGDGPVLVLPGLLCDDRSPGTRRR